MSSHDAPMDLQSETKPDPGNPTYTEAWALIESAKRMAAPLERAPLENPNNRHELREALRLNWRLWTIFQSELAVNENDTVPTTLRQNILNLCNFVDKQTVDTLHEPTPEKVAALIDINCNVANGLLETMAA